MHPITPANLRWEGKTPYAPDYKDTYFSREGGLEETRHVFLAGNRLPERWQGCTQFTIGETGFGAGLNFLATWQAWRKHAPQEARLHYLSTELHPLTPDDLKHCLSLFPEFEELASLLLAAYPAPIPGYHRLTFDNGRVILTLMLGGAEDMLSQAHATVNAWYLDGFAPDRNPAMWSPELLQQIARLTAANGTLATYSVAGQLRRNLEAAGFTLERTPGFGSKNQMLRGTFINAVIASDRRERGNPEQPSSEQATLDRHVGQGPPRDDKPWFAIPSSYYKERSAIIIGAGIAGTSACEALTRRGWHVTLIERHDAPAQEASGNPAGIVMPWLAAEWSPASRFCAAAFQYTIQTLRHLQLQEGDSGWHPTGLLHLANSRFTAERQSAIAQKLGLPDDYLQPVDQKEASERSGLTLKRGGLWYSQAGWVEPQKLCSALLEAAHPRLERLFHTEVLALHRQADNWQVSDSEGRLLAEAPVVIIANANDACRFDQTRHMPLQKVRGQISLLPSSVLCSPLKAPVSYEGYLCPTAENTLCLGATFEPENTSIETVNTLPRDDGVTSEAHTYNLSLLSPHLASSFQPDPSSLSGRIGFRCCTPDQLPVVGPVIDHRAFQVTFSDLHHGRSPSAYPPAPTLEGLYLTTGHGSRGLTSALLCAETLACMINYEPLPLENRLLDCLHPARFLVRRLKSR